MKYFNELSTSVMTVKELIDKLKLYPDNTPIFVPSDDDYGKLKPAIIEDDSVIQDTDYKEDFCFFALSEVKDEKNEEIEKNQSVADELSILIKKLIADKETIQNDNDLTDSGKLKKTQNTQQEIDKQKKILQDTELYINALKNLVKNFTGVSCLVFKSTDN